MLNHPPLLCNYCPLPVAICLWGPSAHSGSPHPSPSKPPTAKVALLLFTRPYVTRVSLCYQDWSTVSQSLLTRASASPVAGVTGVRHCTQLIFVFLVEMGFTMLAWMSIINSAQTVPPKYVFTLPAVTHNCYPFSISSTYYSVWTQQTWEHEMARTDHLRSEVQDQPGQHAETPVVVHACKPQLLGKLRQENHSNPGGGGCSESRFQHCTPAWVTEQDSVSKKERKNGLENSQDKGLEGGLGSESSRGSKEASMVESENLESQAIAFKCSSQQNQSPVWRQLPLPQDLKKNRQKPSQPTSSFSPRQNQPFKPQKRFRSEHR
ncbi:hypothetical protein AAY473_028093 [Plecturocebus cupreus]